MTGFRHMAIWLAGRPGDEGTAEIPWPGNIGGPPRKYKGWCADVPDNTYFDPVFKHNGTFVKTKGYCTDILFKATLSWIKQVKDAEQPFFAFLSTNAPHSLFIAPPAYQKHFQDLGFGKSAAGFYGMIEHIDYNAQKDSTGIPMCQEPSL